MFQEGWHKDHNHCAPRLWIKVRGAVKNASLKTQSWTPSRPLLNRKKRSTKIFKWPCGKSFRIFNYSLPLRKRRKTCRVCCQRDCSGSLVSQRGRDHWISYSLTNSCKAYSNSAAPTKTCLRMQWTTQMCHWTIERCLATTVNSSSSSSTKLVKIQECTLSRLNKPERWRPWSWKDLQSMADR